MTASDKPAAAAKPSTQPLLGATIGANPVRLWGMSSAERLRRELVRNGVPEVRAWDGDAKGSAHILLRTDFVFDEVLVRDLIQAPDTILIDPASGEPVAAHCEAADTVATATMLSESRVVPADLSARLRVIGPGDLSSTYNHQLRKRENPFLLRLTREALPAIEKRMFAGSYKGVTDIITKYVWPLPARHVTKWCSLIGLSPNMVTSIGAILMLLALYLFAQGQYLPGLAAAWVMTFLDTVDGKLARVTLTSSKWGNIFDHGIDLVHPPFWWWAWLAGLSVAGFTMPGGEGWVLAVIWAGYVSQRLQEGYFLSRFKIDMHTWRPFDSFFRLITARRNPNLVVLTIATLLGRPDIGMLLVAIWIVLCFLVHMAQIIQAERAQANGPIRSYLSA
ncbi:CDP-alcohol phosphatidyltransferase family protein [Niveispirillum irakense]|uniref:CDP-alcohol phosphatidyltransferase family protein n=1 Tax=Niveispirillum irakense TaxID=34011 RepID=UPI00042175DD|nr:CDP-alcohol phosphatidyltransferase family protein [Niveispirillum irakense]